MRSAMSFLLAVLVGVLGAGMLVYGLVDDRGDVPAPMVYSTDIDALQ